MSHVRQQIREQIGTILTGLASTGSNVYESRVYPLNESNLPALLIYTKAETSSISTIGTSLGVDREITVIVEVYVKANSNFDDTVDTVCAEVEVAMGSNRTLNDTARFNYLESTDIEFSGDGENPVGVATMSFIVQYRTLQNAPETSI